MKWFKETPREPGFYWIAEAGGIPHVVEVNIEHDSHNMIYVLLPGDDHKYSLEFWEGALWMGPLRLPE